MTGDPLAGARRYFAEAAAAARDWRYCQEIEAERFNDMLEDFMTMHPALADDILLAAAPIFAALLAADAELLASVVVLAAADLPGDLATLRRIAIEQAIALRNDVRAHPGMPDV